MADDHPNPSTSTAGDDEPNSKKGLLVAIASTALLLVFAALQMQLPFLLMGVVVISIVLWQACDPFAEAAQWIGTQFRIPGSVRGATLDAVASSIPELFSGIFFVLLAVKASQGEDGLTAAQAGAEGYGSSIATCAGSAIYNMILIPAIVAIVISYKRKSRPTVDVEDEVLARDGTWFLVCEMVLLAFLFQDRVYWWMGVVLLAMYGLYVVKLYRDTRAYRLRLHTVETYFKERGIDEPVRDALDNLKAKGIKVHELMAEKVRDSVKAGEALEDDEEEDAPETASAFFGLFDIKLNKLSAWMVILVTTIIAATACYFLVEVTRDTALILGVPTFFVAVILAAAASSVPDTFLSVGSAMRGDDSGAVSNAFGSNIFDICICLSVPLLLNSALVGWAPIELTQDGKPMEGLVGLRIMLWVLTALTLAIMWHKRQLTRNKAFILCGLYLLFIAYAVLGSLKIIDV